jgi:autotransporter-associated beta strand protein
MSRGVSIRCTLVAFCASVAFVQFEAPAYCQAIDFNNGTNQGWTRAGFFDDGGATPIPGAFVDEPAPWTGDYNWPNVPPDAVAPAGHGAIILGGNGLAPTSPTGDVFVHWEFNSPDFSSDPVWREPTSFRFGLLGDISSASGAFNFVQVIWHVIRPDGVESFFREFDLQTNTPIFHQVTQNATAWETIDVVHTLPEGTQVLDLFFRVFFESGNPYSGFIAIDEIVPIDIVAVWSSPGGGAWSEATKWNTGRVPNGFDQRAVFGNSIASPATVAVDSDVSIGEIVFDSSTASYTIADDSSHRLTLAGPATIHVTAGGNHTIAAPIAGTNGLTKTGPGTLTLSGPKIYTGDTHVSGGTMIVPNQVLPGDNIDVAADTTLTLRQFVTYPLQPNQTLSGRGNVIVEHANSSTELEVVLTSTLRGTLNVQADNVINSGRIAPGFSPGIIRIDGDYSQENSGVLEIEVGGLTPGTQHDQLQVTGSASLDGRLEVPLIDGFVPVAGNEIQFLIAQERNGVFDSIFSPNLAAVAPNLALDVDEFQGRIRFVNVAPVGTVQFTAQDPIVSWHDGETWNQTPGTAHPVTISNLIGTPQVVELSNSSAFTHQLTVGGGPSNITVAVEDANLSATAGVMIGSQGIIELNDGNLVSANTNVQPGGELSGSGTVVGNLIVGGSNATEAAIVSPGLSIGHIDVEGNYQQGPGGILVIEVEGTNAGQIDTIDVSQSATLGGTLRVDVSDQASLQAGDTIRLMTAGNFVRDTVFENIETNGTEDLFLAVSYPNIGVAGGQAAETFQSLNGIMYQRGDMNHDRAVNPEDVPYFALALMSRRGYFDALTPTGACICDFGQAGGDFPGADGLRDGRLDFDDIEGFSNRVGMSPTAVAAAITAYSAIVPETSSAVLIVVGGIVGLTCRRGVSYAGVT